MLLDFEKLIKKYQMNITGVIHIGAHYGEEYGIYTKANIEKMQFFEPLSSNYEELIKNIPSNLCHKTALGNYTGIATMNVEKNNKGQSSSLLEPVLHLIQYPHIEFNTTETVNITTLDSFNLSGYNLINIDVQGYELEVFKGAEKTLRDNNLKIFVSIHDDLGIRDYDTTPEDTISYLESFGYVGEFLAKNHEAHWYFEEK